MATSIVFAYIPTRFGDQGLALLCVDGEPLCYVFSTKEQLSALFKTHRIDCRSNESAQRMVYGIRELMPASGGNRPLVRIAGAGAAVFEEGMIAAVTRGLQAEQPFSSEPGFSYAMLLEEAGATCLFLFGYTSASELFCAIVHSVADVRACVEQIQPGDRDGVTRKVRTIAQDFGEHRLPAITTTPWVLLTGGIVELFWLAVLGKLVSGPLEDAGVQVVGPAGGFLMNAPRGQA